MPIEVLMPALSPTMTEGKLAKWLKSEGETIESGDVLAEIETDKATMEIEAVEEGILGRILVAEGTDAVPVNQPIALILEEGEDAASLDGVVAAPPTPAPASTAPPTPAPAPAPPPEPAAAAPAPRPATAPEAARPIPVSTGAGGHIFASPLARRMAKQAGLDLASIAGSGPKGRIVKADVEAALSGGAPAPAAAPASRLAPEPAMPTGAYTDTPHSTMRKIIAARLTEAKQTVPHFYMTMDFEIDRLLAARKEINAASPEGDGAYKVSVNDLVIKGVAQALKRMPAVNASWTDAGLRTYTSVDIAVAVATEGGLITPIVRDADRKGLATIANEMKDFAARARAGKLMPEEYQGGGFSISNLGMYGVKEFAAIINPPQSCILAVGAGEQRPVVRDGELAIASMMSCTLSCDHRVVDGALGARFMQVLKGFIESPATMLA